MIRAVIDTNVLVSGLLSSHGNEALALLAIQHGLIHPCFSADILAEYAEVLARPKFSFPPEDIAAVLTMLQTKGSSFVADDVPKPVLPDPDDAMFVQCALLAGATYMVTGNKRHFPREACGGIQVVSAGELLDQITLDG